MNVVENIENHEIIVMISELQIGMIQEMYIVSVIISDDKWYDSGVVFMFVIIEYFSRIIQNL